MLKLNETQNLQNLARFDFLDLCLLGETGTGKTHAARLIHELSPRSQKPFIAVNCAELNPSVIEAELFGYEKGAFTGAVVSKTGKFEAAAGGTLFLDEIGEFEHHLQAKLLKAVEEKYITRVGSVVQRPVNLRIIYATNRDLAVFREDFRYRVATHTIRLKPLRERPEDIIPLALQFIAEFNLKSESKISVSKNALLVLKQADWRGNVRELRTFIEKVCLSALFASKSEETAENAVELTKELILAKLSLNLINPSNKIDFSDSDYSTTFAPAENMVEILRQIETYLLKSALDNHNNNQTRAAKELGISRSGLIKKLKRIGH